MKKFLIIAISIIVLVALFRSCGGGGTAVNGYTGVVKDVNGNVLELQNGLKVKLIGVAEDHRVEAFLRSKFSGHRVKLVTDSRTTKKTFDSSSETVVAYVVDTDVRGYCINRQVVDLYPDAYRPAEMKDSTDWVTPEGELKEIAELALYMKARTFLVATSQGTGSGFFINDKGLAVTNYHVLEPDQQDECRIYLYDEDPQSNDVREDDPHRVKAIHFASDTEHMDLCIFTVEMNDGDRCEYFRIAKNRPTQGAKLGTYGNPLGTTAKYCEGTLSGIIENFDNRGIVFLQYTNPVNPGNSGGPVCDKYGQVVGINDLLRLDANGICYGIDAQELRKVLDELGYKYGGK